MVEEAKIGARHRVPGERATAGDVPQRDVHHPTGAVEHAGPHDGADTTGDDAGGGDSGGGGD